jgi:hypothetical protein
MDSIPLQGPQAGDTLNETPGKGSGASKTSAPGAIHKRTYQACVSNGPTYPGQPR